MPLVIRIEQNWQYKQQVCKAKVKNGEMGTRVELLEQGQNVQETAPVDRQEGAGGQSFTVLCFPKGMHSCPRVGDNYTAASQ